MSNCVLEGLKELRRKRRCNRSLKTYKIYSKILDDYLWITTNREEMRGLINDGIQEPVYIYSEIEKMHSENISQDVLKKIHCIKKTFPGCSIENIEDNKL